MKKLVYLLVVVGAMLTSCDPMEDIYNDIDSVDKPIVGTEDYTLTDDDYADLELGFGSFDSDDQAKELIPGFLSEAFPYWGNGSAVLVTYNLYQSNSIKSETAYTVTDEDYATLGFNYGNFDSAGDMTELLMYKYPDATRGAMVDLTYKYYSGGSTSEVTNNFILLDSWEMVREFSTEEYNAMEQTYPNFSSQDVAEFNISVYLESLYPYAKADDRVVTMYELYVSGGDNRMIIVPFVFDGTKWNAIESVIENSLQFGNDNGTWVPDNTIRYALVGADYEYMSEQLITEPGFESPAESMGYYKNLDRRLGNENYWSDDTTKNNAGLEDMIETGLAILLDKIDPSAADGQKYLMTYDIYNGTNTTETTPMIKTDGVWVRNN
ncbi:conserved hypothetical protein [Formosa agariphila KMM 3901]|uniref:Lipoprotein n=1 Tax=Formosa agariphila (strain DSM 15362 / KCTC 12365 / LMG 23005 / KMM 3901 / M-2Alg 35-1) TaxID=1347342 RepID=T2KRD1_FORAG|nr:hypothetical protein [Formosa agariphila]CDF81011.1 conserved hypothetical protein [Formosa agariphila KMM 3901]